MTKWVEKQWFGLLFLNELHDNDALRKLGEEKLG